MMNKYKHTVQYYETDKMGIAHHSNYIRWMEEARVDFLSQIGWDYDKLEELGVASPVTAIDCKYKTSCTFADDVFISVKVEELKGVRLKIYYEMKNKDDKILCEAHSEHCFLDKEGKIVRLQKEFPDFYNALADLTEEER